MLGKTAGGLYWMFRYLERSENITRLLDAAFHIALTRSSTARNEWASAVSTTGTRAIYEDRHGDSYEAASVIDFLLRDVNNPSSVMHAVEVARTNARVVRTALTREVWEATNEYWMKLKSDFRRPVLARNLPVVLEDIRKQAAQVRAAMTGTMLRNDIYNFARIGTFLERADSTARILDVKYYVLLPSVSPVGSSLDNVQWETILRSVSARRAYRWLYGAEPSASDIANFLILDGRMPRSLAFCHAKIVSNLGYLARSYGDRQPCHDLADAMAQRLASYSVDDIQEFGLHEFLEAFLRDNNALGLQIEKDYRFNE